MKITNIHGMPDAVVEAVRNDPYSRGDSKYSVSDLVTPPRIVHLTRRHDDEISVDVVDRFWALFGQVAHGILERAGGGGEVEKRYFSEVNGVMVSGQVDLIKDGIIYDYKTTSAWTIVYGSRMKEWEQRMNCYAALAGLNGENVKGLRIIALLRDWQESKVGGKYPDAPMIEIELPLWSAYDSLAYIVYKVEALEAAGKLADDELPYCEPEDMWERNGKRIRCERYCPARDFCNQYKEWRENE